MKKTITSALTAALALGLVISTPFPAAAHCDTLDGPVVNDARTALAKGDPTPVLKWVRPADEAAIRQAFAETSTVRRLSPEARELADRHFFETLVRVHRSGEGAPYTGLKPAGQVEPPVARADLALEKGSVDDFAKIIGRHAEEGVRERFVRTAAAKKEAADSVAAGRRYVESYVDYVHYVEGLVKAVHQGPAHGGTGDHGH